MTNGIDVSRHNGSIDWKAVKASGKVDFAIIRAGYGKSITQKDSQFESNYQGCKANGIPVGAYWYSYAVLPSEAVEEAHTFLEAIKGKQFEMPVYLDIEEKAQLASGKSNVSAIVKAFCDVMEKAGYWVGVYASRSAVQTYFDDEVKKRYALWVAEWGAKCNYNGTYGMWQNSETGTVSGINGNVDTDIRYVDYPAAIKATGKNGFPKPEKPVTDDAKHILYIPGMTAADVQVYLAWISEIGAGNYKDTVEDFERFLNA